MYYNPLVQLWCSWVRIPPLGHGHWCETVLAPTLLNPIWTEIGFTWSHRCHWAQRQRTLVERTSVSSKATARMAKENDHSTCQKGTESNMKRFLSKVLKQHIFFYFGIKNLNLEIHWDRDRPPELTSPMLGQSALFGIIVDPGLNFYFR